jgi:hypothetical protein
MNADSAACGGKATGERPNDRNPQITQTHPPLADCTEKRRRQFLEDAEGRRAWVVLPIEEYEELIEAVEQREDIRRLEEGKKLKGEDVPWEQVKAKLRAEGKRPWCADGLQCGVWTAAREFTRLWRVPLSDPAEPESTGRPPGGAKAAVTCRTP